MTLPRELLDQGWTQFPTTPVCGVDIVTVRAPSGLRVMLLQSETPLCDLYAVLSTEAVTNAWSHKDDGVCIFFSVPCCHSYPHLRLL